MPCPQTLPTGRAGSLGVWTPESAIGNPTFRMGRTSETLGLPLPFLIGEETGAQHSSGCRACVESHHWHQNSELLWHWGQRLGSCWGPWKERNLSGEDVYDGGERDLPNSPGWDLLTSDLAILQLWHSLVFCVTCLLSCKAERQLTFSLAPPCFCRLFCK